MAEYSEPFGVLLLSSFVGDARGRAGAHIPRELQQRVSGYMQRLESAREERVREFIHAQDAELERARQQTQAQSAIVAEIVSKVNPQPAAPAAPSQRGGGSSGLAAMLRGGAGSNTGAGGNPFARGGGRPAAAATPTADSLSDGEFELDDAEFSAIGVAGRLPGLGLGRRLSQGTGSRQSDDYSDTERNEGAFGDFDSERVPRASGRGGASNLSHMMAGSMPIQIPMYGSSLTGDPSLNRREYQRRADELEMSRRREQMLRGMPKTFVPPHQLMDSIHETDSEMLIGSKPRDSYGMSRRQAPG
ncbi:hypothetical protein GGF43_001233 [Coemansia sp. RSA 2618]|nr:hypothetical protein GGF43_001233 [Coemansia sp. RSA 2618]